MWDWFHLGETQYDQQKDRLSLHLAQWLLKSVGLGLYDQPPGVAS